jgi:hypothetical protein
MIVVMTGGLQSGVRNAMWATQLAAKAGGL